MQRDIIIHKKNRNKKISKDILHLKYYGGTKEINTSSSFCSRTHISLPERSLNKMTVLKTPATFLEFWLGFTPSWSHQALGNTAYNELDFKQLKLNTHRIFLSLHMYRTIQVSNHRRSQILWRWLYYHSKRKSYWNVSSKTLQKG